MGGGGGFHIVNNKNISSILISEFGELPLSFVPQASPSLMPQGFPAVSWKPWVPRWAAVGPCPAPGAHFHCPLVDHSLKQPVRSSCWPGHFLSFRDYGMRFCSGFFQKLGLPSPISISLPNSSHRPATEGNRIEILNVF